MAVQSGQPGRPPPPALAGWRGLQRVAHVEPPVVRHERLDHHLRARRDVGDHPLARKVASVRPRQHRIVVNVGREALPEHQHTDKRADERHWQPACADQPPAHLYGGVRPEQRHDREHRQEPPAEEPLLVAHQHYEHDRRRQQEQRRAEPSPCEQHDCAADRRERRPPPETPRERPQVIGDAAAASSSQLHRILSGRSRCLLGDP